MDKSFQIMPPEASGHAGSVDMLYFFLLAVTAFFSLLIFASIVFFAIRYRRRHADEIPHRVEGALKLEIAWTVIPFIIVMAIFFWGAKLYFDVYRPPEDAMEIHVIGKQWMWKIQHPDGKREINELHVPVGRSVKVILSSQDVIHSFFIPAFRVKQDAVPGRYTVTWFRATKVGEYHLFCAQYCGTQHANMIGRVIVMEEPDYQAWLAGTVSDEPPQQAGARLYQTLSCATCHGITAPTLSGLYGSQVPLADGSTVIADDNYLRESITDSTTRIVAGYQPIMPSYRGQISEEQLNQLVAYIKSLKNPPATQPAGTVIRQ